MLLALKLIYSYICGWVFGFFFLTLLEVWNLINEFWTVVYFLAFVSVNRNQDLGGGGWGQQEFWFIKGIGLIT